MSVFFNIIGFMGSVLILSLAVVGVVAIVAASTGDNEHSKSRRRARLAEEQIAEIGRQAQVQLLGEAMRRALGPRDHQGNPRDGQHL